MGAEFAASVAAQTEAIRRGDPNAGNGHAKRYIRAFEELRAKGDGPDSRALAGRHVGARSSGLTTAASGLQREDDSRCRIAALTPSRPGSSMPGP